MAADFKLYNHFELKFKQAVERLVSQSVLPNLFSISSYGKEELEADVARLQELNEQLREDCVLDVGDNSKLSGDFK